MPSTTFYPSEDGWVQRDVSGGSGQQFSTMRTGNGTDAGEADNDAAIGIWAATVTTDRYHFLARAVAWFDTSSIPDTAVITAATISVVGTDKASGLGGQGLHVCGSTSTNTTTVVAADYQARAGTSFGSKGYTSFLTDGTTYNDITLNASGLAAIDKTGYSRFTFRISGDMLNDEPTWHAGAESYVNILLKEEPGTGVDPKLVVTYTTLPTVTTQAVSSIAATTATANGTITDDGDEPTGALKRGVVYGTTSLGDPGDVSPGSSGYTSYVQETAGGYAEAAFTESLTGLTTGATYYVRAFASTAAGYDYGDEVSFTPTSPASAPTVTTQAVTSIGTTTATGNGNVTSDGGGAITERGAAWSTSVNPTIAGDHATSAGTTGAYTTNITGLSTGTLYHVRAYATNSAGTSYGSDVTFTTNGWTNPDNAFADDASYATIAAASGVLAISLSGDNGVSYSAALEKTYNSSESSQTYGDGSTELWGQSWTGLTLDDTKFKLKVSVGGIEQVYDEFGFTAADSVILTGIEVVAKAKYDSGTFSLNHVKVKIYYGTSQTPVQEGSLAFATDGGGGDGALVVYYNGGWNELQSGASSGATAALDNLSSVAINAALVLATSDAFALGSATKQWSDLFLAEGGVINWDNGDATLTQTGNNLTLAGAQLNTDIIGETTADTGVTIDGLLIKDSKLATNNSVVTANITDAAVTVAKRAGGFFAKVHAFADATGSQSITGVGFQPKALIILGSTRSSTSQMYTTNGYAYDTGSGTTQGCVSGIAAEGDAIGSISSVSNAFVRSNASGSGVFVAALTSWDADGITVNVTTSSGTAEDRTYHIMFFG